MQNISDVSVWIGFSIFVVIALSIDTFLLGKNSSRGPHSSMRASLYWTLLWIFSALLFNGILWIYLYFTTDLIVANQKALDFLAGYLIEKSLSVDNLFTFYMIFHQFRIPIPYQQRVFAYGIWSAIVFRLILILLGTWLVGRFHWVLYLLGAFLIVTGVKMILFEKQEKDLAAGFTFQLVRRFFRVSEELHGHQFFIKKNHVIYITRLFVALVFIEISDIIFAFDSIPAIFAITHDPFIVWTSNIFAILGLRALYFLLAGMVDRFHLLKYGIAIILVFVGVKMLLEPILPISTLFSLGIVIGILLSFILISIFFHEKHSHPGK